MNILESICSYCAFYSHGWRRWLGFDLRGKQSYLEALRVFSLFCQHGLHYRGRARDINRDHMRQLYLALLRDLHLEMKPFWKEPLLVYNELMTVDNKVFAPQGALFSAHRDLKLEVAEQDRLAHMGFLPHDNSPSASVRRAPPCAAGLGSGQADGKLDGTSANATGRPTFAVLGSFACAIREELDKLSILGMRYARKTNLRQLKLTESEICLASYLSRKGDAACPNSDRPGHERLDLALHVFSDSAKAMQPMFDQSPYGLPHMGYSRKGRRSGAQPGPRRRPSLARGGN